MPLMKFTVKVGKANTNSKSLRIALPIKVAELLDIQQGDSLDYEVNRDGSVTLTKADE